MLKYFFFALHKHYNKMERGDIYTFLLLKKLKKHTGKGHIEQSSMPFWSLCQF